MHTAKYGGRIDMQRATSRENNSNAAGEPTEKRLSLWEIDIYLQHIFKDRTYVNQPRLLLETGETSVRIARSCRLFLSLISLLTVRLHKLC